MCMINSTDSRSQTVMFAETESMECPPFACLIERALTILISMGSHGRPKTLKKLENVLRPCTMVAPYVDPLEALEIANRRSQKPEPPVLSVEHNKVKVSSSKALSDEDFRLSLLENVQECWRAYDFAFPGGKTYDEITGSVLAWLGEWETREGTTEQLVQGLFEQCQKKVDRSPFEIISRLQSRGFLEVHEEKVSYSLPEFDRKQSRVLLAFRDTEGRSKSMCALFRLYRCQCEGKSMYIYNDLVGPLLENVYKVPGGYSLTGIEHPGRDSPCWLSDESSCSDADAGDHHDTLGGVFRDGIEDVLWDIYAAHVLSRLPSENRPDNLSDLITLIEPESLVLAVSPRQIIQMANKRGGDGRRRRSRGGARKRNRQVATEVVLGLAPGETSAEERIPLTPEGLLGIHAHIATSGQKPEPKSCVPPKDQTTPMDSPPTWLLGDKRRANGLSKEFAAKLFHQLTMRAKNSNAVPVAGSEREKEETISRILEWLDAHCSPSRHADRDNLPWKPPTIKKLQRELICLCAIQPRRIAPGTIVRCLEKSGYVTIHSGESPEVTYNITDVRAHRGPVRIADGLAPWQQDAERLRQSVSKCYAVYFKRAFPPVACASRTPLPSRVKRGKRRGRTCLQMNKKLKHL